MKRENVPYWYEMHLAPKDGTRIIAWPCYSSGTHIVWWNKGVRKEGWKDYLGYVPVQPRFWTYCLKPPKMEQVKRTLPK